MTDMLRSAITDGTGSAMKSAFKHYSKIPIVGKTGTTSDDAMYGSSAIHQTFH